jgi:hypothetical protein
MLSSGCSQIGTGGSTSPPSATESGMSRFSNEMDQINAFTGDEQPNNNDEHNAERFRFFHPISHEQRWYVADSYTHAR